MKRLLLATLVTSLGCGAAGRQVHNASGDPEPVVRPDPTRDGPKPEHLDVVAVTITSGKEVMFIKADGGIERKGQQGRIATLRTTGELLHENGGLLLTLNPDGTITGTNLQSAQYDDIVIGPDGELTQNGRSISTVSTEGVVMQGGEEVAQISGAEAGHRAAMLVFLMYFDEDGNGQSDGDGDGDGSDGDGTGETTAPEPATATPSG